MSTIPATRSSASPSTPAATAPTSGTRRNHNLAVYGLVLVANTLFALSLQLPWWFLRLYAPQYPHGLTLIISLTGLTGDTREVDMLNHYIGMAHLDAAAAWERQYASAGVLLLALALVVVALWAKRSWSWLLGALGAAFPTIFLADCFYWLYRFGHELDPHAPLRLAPFTPQLFGNGNIGQFLTFARPERGFWVAVLAALLLVAASVLRMRAAPRTS